MSFPNDSAFGQEVDMLRRHADAQAARASQQVKVPTREELDERIREDKERRASTDHVYSEVDAILSLIEGPGAVPAGNVAAAASRLQDLRDHLYSRL